MLKPAAWIAMGNRIIDFKMSGERMPPKVYGLL